MPETKRPRGWMSPGRTCELLDVWRHPAVRDLTMGDYQHMDKSVRPGEGYYLSVLHMLSLFAVTLKTD